MSQQTTHNSVASILLRVGLAAVFLYAAIAALWHPVEWLGFLPGFVKDSSSAETILKLIALYELLLALWLLIGKQVKYAALLAAVTLAGIVILNLGQLIITFRDVGLACMALALYFAER